MPGCACSYNLPETVRESDIEKLSFAVQLAEGFYADVQVRWVAAPPQVICRGSRPAECGVDPEVHNVAGTRTCD